MTNSEIGSIFRNIADLLTIKGENPFKVRAYRRVVRSIEELTTPVADLAREERLDEIPGAGEAIKKKLIELVQTGRLEFYEKLKAEFPDGVSELLSVTGIGPQTAAWLVKEAGITSIAALENALNTGQALPKIKANKRDSLLQSIRNLPGTGRK